MDPDTLFVLGLGLALLSTASIVSAISKGGRPRIATITVMVAGAMVVWAITNKPGGYPIGSIPKVVAKVIASYT